MSPPLSPESERRISLLFSAENRTEAASLLVDQCGNNLPFCEKYDQFQMERARFAALKLSDGSLEKLKAAIELGGWPGLETSIFVPNPIG
jgi:hypothetical protein